MSSLLHDSHAATPNASTTARWHVPVEVAELNALYIQEVSRRALAPAVITNTWRGKIVRVFLRHDKVRVFAIACGQRVGMADFVALEQVRFCVDEAGRRQTLAEQGPLPNRRTIHAWLTGRLLWASDHGRQPSGPIWSGVVFNPVHMRDFCCEENSVPLKESRFAMMTPGRVKVWCDRSSVPCLAAGTLNDERPTA
ncbi:MAG: hypothetical protein R3C19_20955 [Planctomycetaceae bacterium]